MSGQRLRGRRVGAAVLVLAVAATGCGYAARGTLPDHVKTVAVPIFANRTQQPAVEGFITRAVVEAFTTNGRLRVVPVEQADALLEGEVVQYAATAIAFDASTNVTLYRLSVTLNLRLRDLRRNDVLFQQAGVQEQADFRVFGPVSQTIAREETALRGAATEIGRAVVGLAIDRF